MIEATNVFIKRGWKEKTMTNDELFAKQKKRLRL